MTRKLLCGINKTQRSNRLVNENKLDIMSEKQTSVCFEFQDAVIHELKNTTNAIREKKLLQQEEVYNGALEDILLGLVSLYYKLMFEHN